MKGKGQEIEQEKVKWDYLDEWKKGVNSHGGFWRWRWAVARDPGEIQDILIRSADHVFRLERQSGFRGDLRKRP